MQEKLQPESGRQALVLSFSAVYFLTFTFPFRLWMMTMMMPLFPLLASRSSTTNRRERDGDDDDDDVVFLLHLKESERRWNHHEIE